MTLAAQQRKPSQKYLIYENFSVQRLTKSALLTPVSDSKKSCGTSSWKIWVL